MRPLLRPSPFFGALNRTSGASLDNAPVDAAKLGGLLNLISDNTISGRIAKEVFEEMWDSGKDAATIVDEKGLKQISDTGALEGIIDELIANNADQVQQIKDGNQKVIGRHGKPDPEAEAGAIAASGRMPGGKRAGRMPGGKREGGRRWL